MEVPVSVAAYSFVGLSRFRANDREKSPAMRVVGKRLYPNITLGNKEETYSLKAQKMDSKVTFSE